MTHAGEPGSVRRKVLDGGRYLLLRQGLGLGIGMAGVLLLTRLLGPADYGVYAAALAIVTFVTEVARLGLDVYLVRREQPPDRAVYSQGFTLLLICGVALAALSLLTHPLLRMWFEDDRFVAPLQVLLLATPLMLIYQPPLAALQRELNFRKVAFLELAGQLIFYGSSVALALITRSVWAAITGFWLWQAWMVMGTFWAARLRPKLVWSPALVREMLRYGAAYSAANWIWSARLLVNPLIVGRYLGPSGVAYVSLTLRLVDVLSFVRTATWRLSIAALAKVQGDLARLRRVMDEATMLQILGVGPLLFLGAVGVLVLPDVLGPSWDPVIEFFPFVALGSLANSAFAMHTSVLYVLKRNREVAAFHVAFVVLFAGATLLLVPMFGLTGYGLAEIAALGSYALIHRYIRKLFPLRYNMSAPWLFALAPPIFITFVPLPYTPLLFVPAAVLLAIPRFRRMVTYYMGQLRPRVGQR